MIKRIYFVWMLCFGLAILGCEDLEDTYDAGDGMIRYLGKCTDVKVTAGWERLHIEWKNNYDPAVERIRVTCKAGDILRDTMLEAGTTSCDFRNMEDGKYEVNVYAVDANGNQSLSEANYGTPVTLNHEVVRSFTKGVTKHFFMENDLVMFFDMNSESILNIQLHYYNTSGELKTIDSLQKKFDDRYMLLRDVNTARPIFIDRKGKVEGCLDEIKLPVYELEKDVVFSSDFRNLVKARYGLEEINEVFMDTVTHLEFDYDITTFEDVLYFPNLKKIVLGKNRYLNTTYLALSIPSVVSDLEKSAFILSVAQELRELEIERYNQHYFADGATSLNITSMGNPTLPDDIAYLDTSGWMISSSEQDNSSTLQNLLDNNQSTSWNPGYHPSLVTYTLEIDMKEVKFLNGLKIAQTLDPLALKLVPNMMDVQVSAEGETWESFSWASTIGNSFGEITLIRLNTPKEARYIRLIVSDRLVDNVAGISIADVAFF